MRCILLIAIICLSAVSCDHADKQTANNVGMVNCDTVSHATDEAAIKKAVDDSYRFISFKQGEQVKFDDAKKYFMRQAQLYNFRNDSLEVLSIDGFVNAYKDFLKTNAISSFYEEEITGRTEQFGRIAQRISIYRTYLNTMDSAAERGVNSFQLIKTDEGWRISSIIWDVESVKLKIPGYYLKGK